MKKNLTLLSIIFTLYINAQSIILENTFGTEGIYTYSDQTNGESKIQSLIQPDGKILVSGQRINGLNNSEVYISRLNSNGTLDTSFGENGFYTGYQNTNETSSNLYYTNDKILIFYSEQGILIKLNYDGTPDSSFGNNGIFTIIGEQFYGEESVLIDNILYVTSTNSLNKIDILTETVITIPITSIYNIRGVYKGPNGNLLLKSINDSSLSDYITLIDVDGIIASNFGTNGTITANISSTLNEFDYSYDFISTDSSNNIYYCITNELNLTSTIKKFDSNGLPVTSFATNGSYEFSNNLTVDLKLYSDQIYLAGANIDNSNLNLFLARLNPDGTLDNTFDNDGVFIFDANSLNEWAESLNIISESTIVVAGEYLGEFNNNTHVSKFVTTQNLSVTQINNNDSIWFENPIKSNIIFTTSDEIVEIKLYNINGSYVKSIYQNNTQVSELSKGIYVLKVKFKNGKIFTKKLFKN